MSVARRHLEALQLHSEALENALACGDLSAIEQIVEQRSLSIAVVLEQRDQLAEEDRVLFRAVLHKHDSHAQAMKTLRDSIAEEIRRIRHGRSVARAQRATAGPVRFISERC